MFEKYLKIIKERAEKFEEVIDLATTRAGVHFINSAQDLTDKDGLVDTTTYKKSFTADTIKDNENYKIVVGNNIEYASFLENGYNAKKHFVPFKAIQGSNKGKEIMAKMKAKYPNAKGFMAKAGRVKGHFIIKRAKDDTEQFLLKFLETQTQKLLNK